MTIPANGATDSANDWSWKQTFECALGTTVAGPIHVRSRRSCATDGSTSEGKRRPAWREDGVSARSVVRELEVASAGENPLRLGK